MIERGIDLRENEWIRERGMDWRGRDGLEGEGWIGEGGIDLRERSESAG